MADIPDFVPVHYLVYVSHDGVINVSSRQIADAWVSHGVHGDVDLEEFVHEWCHEFVEEWEDLQIEVTVPPASCNAVVDAVAALVSDPDLTPRPGPGQLDIFGGEVRSNDAASRILGRWRTPPPAVSEPPSPPWPEL